MKISNIKNDNTRLRLSQKVFCFLFFFAAAPASNAKVVKRILFFIAYRCHKLKRN